MKPNLRHSDKRDGKPRPMLPYLIYKTMNRFYSVNPNPILQQLKVQLMIRQHLTTTDKVGVNNRAKIKIPMNKHGNNYVNRADKRYRTLMVTEKIRDGSGIKIPSVRSSFTTFTFPKTHSNNLNNRHNRNKQSKILPFLLVFNSFFYYCQFLEVVFQPLRC